MRNPSDPRARRALTRREVIAALAVLAALLVVHALEQRRPGAPACGASCLTCPAPEDIAKALTNSATASPSSVAAGKTELAR